MLGNAKQTGLLCRSLWQHDQFRPSISRLADEVTGFAEVPFHVKRLERRQH
jgi:hypothetical protein